MIELCLSRVYGCCEKITSGEEATECKLGDQISNNLIMNELFARSAARAIIDTEGYDWKVLQAVCSLHEDIAPKSIAQATDKRNGTYKSRVSKSKITIRRGVGNVFSARSTLELHVPK